MALGLVGMAACDQVADHRDHLGDGLGARAARPLAGRQPSAATSSWNCLAVASVTLRIASFERQVGIRLAGTGVDLVVDVGDVADIGDVILAIEMAQQAEQHVEDDDRPRIADMGVVVDRRPADIHAHVIVVEGDEVLLRARQRVVDAQTFERARQCNLPVTG